MQLDLLEKNVLKAIEASSIFSIGEIIMVYESCKSFDKTIDILKYSVSKAVGLEIAMIELGRRPQNLPKN